MYSKRDFEVIEQLFDRIAILLLDNVLADSKKTREEVEFLEQHHRVTKEKLETLFSDQPNTAPALQKPLTEHLMELEARIIKQTLLECKGNKAQAARMLGLRPNTLHYKLKRSDVPGEG